jgi:uncharacterized protein with von Willebrand factor type A (vWA) domain
MSTNAIITGSIGAIARRDGKSIAETFINADVIVIVDTSGSMNSHDSRGGKSRYEVACQELADLQNSLPGKIAVLAFSSEIIFCPAGIPQYFGGGTDLEKALKFAKQADVTGMRFIVISDGEPNSERDAMNVAKTFKNKISTIYVGPEEYPAGREFLERLAKASGGLSVTAEKAQELAANVRLLLKA